MYYTFSDSEDDDTILVDSGPLPATDLAKIRRWLRPTPYDLEPNEYSRHCASHLRGTGEWLTSTKTYERWHSGDNGLLWIKGIPGSGKSVMAASIIDQLHDKNVPVLYFFFRQIIDANHKPIAALRDWLCQVLDYSPPLQVKLKGYVDNRRSIESLSSSVFWKDLKLALESFPKAYCVTDALDEMDRGNDEFLRSLVELGQWRPSNVKVLITSRPVTSVETPLRRFPIQQIRLEERLVDLDIAAYVQYKLRGSSIPEEHWSIIEEAIPGRANGLFLYAKFSMDAFLEPGADAHEALKTLPADLNAMYNELLREHLRRSNVSRDIQFLILQLVTHATRPLRLLEIAEVINTEHPSSGNNNLKETKDLVKAACGPLLEILPDETVSVVHHSFTEFLKGYTRSSDSDNSAYPVLESGLMNKSFAVICLNYLRCLDNQEVTKQGEHDDFFDPKKTRLSGLRLQFPFLEYAAENWYKHTCRAASAGAEMSLVYDLLDTFFAENHRYNAWLRIDWPTPSIDDVTPLHVAAMTGLTQYASRLLQKGEVRVEARDCDDNTPLYWAATRGHAEVVQVLLENGADPDAEQNQGLKPLHQAAGNNRAEVVKALLAAGVDPLTPKTKETPGRWCGNAPRTCGHTPLMYACHNGHAEAVAEFLPFLKNIEVCHQALSWAAGNSRAAIVDMILLHPGVDVNAKYRGDTALFKACKARDFQTIHVLLKAGADPNILCTDADDEFAGISCVLFDRYPRPGQESRGSTALHALCKNDRFSNPIPSECAEILLKAGADVHVKTLNGSTALHFACQSNVNLIKPLLEAGADPTVEDDHGETPLHTNGDTDKELLPLLLGTRTVDINRPRTKDGKTPLMCRLDKRYTKAVIRFLDYKPDVNATDAEGNGALHEAFRNNSVERSVIDALLSAGADPNLKNRHGDTPLHVMRWDMDPEHVCKLLDAGADLESQNIAGQTVLFAKSTSFAAGRKGEPGIFEALINKGARSDTRDYKGRTLWHHGCEQRDLLDYLKNLGLDPNVTDHEGNTPLHELAAMESYRDKIELIKHFTCLGSDIDQPNHRGRTVLHILSSRDDYESRQTKKNQAIDYVLGVSKNLSPRDNDGIQPLHLAATICENNVFKLLNAGADLFAVTNEGMTALHLASRARQSGIVDMILSRLATMETKARVEYVNKKNREGKAALHYACFSGRPETVKSLLEAGSDPNSLDDSQDSPFTMCAYFEDEQKFTDNSQMRRFDFFQVYTEDDTTRLDEIMDLLVQYGALVTGEYGGCLQKSLRAVTLRRFGYTINCILNLAARVPDANIAGSSNRDISFLIATYCHKATKGALKESIGLEVGHKWSESQILHARRALGGALIMRQYGLIEEIALYSSCLIHPDSDGNTVLNDLVHWGYSGLLARVCTRELAIKLDNLESWGEREDAESYDRYRISPLIVSACTRQLPNMDVLKQLVEEYGVNVDAQCREHEHRRGEHRTQMTIGALHRLATGNCWWYVDKALPYLVQKGANLELKNNDGETPLIIALSSTGAFHKEAARLLIKGGADVNAIDDNGKTCLSKAGDDLDLMELLITHGAQVTAETIYSAIELAQVDILEVLLSQGDHANLSPGPIISKWGNPIYSEMYPLLHASSVYSSRIPQFDKKRALMMKMLLKHGADPFATLVKYTKDPKAHNHDFDLDGNSIKSATGFLMETCVVIHEILSRGDMAEPFFQMPSLDLERKDQSGCTLLLAACKNHKTLSKKVPSTSGQDTAKVIFQELTDRGANVMAQDNDGRTVLHLIGHFHFDADFAEILRTVITNNPSLVHQADRAGDTPLHYALRNHTYEYVDLLLENGADPTKPDSNGDTALHHIASKLKEPSLFKRSLNAGIDINSRNNQGDTPLFKYIGVQFASTYRDVFFDLSFNPSSYEKLHDPILKTFHEAGADFFARNNEQSSLLHLLAAINVETILRAANSAPLVIMAQFKYFMDLGLDPMAEDARQRTSLDVAAACGNDHIHKLFERKPME